MIIIAIQDGDQHDKFFTTHTAGEKLERVNRITSRDGFIKICHAS